MARKSNAKGVAWIALIIALIALVFSWIAFSQTGPDMEARVEQEVKETLRTNDQTPTEPVTNSENNTTTPEQPQTSQSATSSR